VSVCPYDKSWLKKAIGEEYFRDEQSVDFATNRGRSRVTNQPKATTATLEYLALLTNIETLELGNNREVTDSSLVLLTPLKNLTTLYLYRTGIRGPGLVHVAKLPKLSAISLSDTELDDSGAKHLGRMSRLAWARLDNTRLTDAGLSELAQATALKTLTLRNTEITDRGLVYLEQLKQLKVLDPVQLVWTVNQSCEREPAADFRLPFPGLPPSAAGRGKGGALVPWSSR
jgi:hypothetical protein